LLSLSLKKIKIGEYLAKLQARREGDCLVYFVYLGTTLLEDEETARDNQISLKLMLKVCVEPPPSAVNVTLPAFAAERRLLQRGARSTAPAALDRHLLPTGRSVANPPAAVAAVDR